MEHWAQIGGGLITKLVSCTFYLNSWLCLAFYTLLWRERHQSVLSETREKIVEDKNMLCPD